MFLEMELPYSNIKKFLYFFKRKPSKLSYIFLYFRKWNPALPNLKRKNHQEKFYIFQEIALTLKKFLYLQKWNPVLSSLNPLNNFLNFSLKINCTEKIYYIFSKESFSYISIYRTQDFSVQAQNNKKSIPRKTS